MGVAASRPHPKCGRGCTYSPLVKTFRNHHCLLARRLSPIATQTLSYYFHTHLQSKISDVSFTEKENGVDCGKKRAFPPFTSIVKLDSVSVL